MATCEAQPGTKARIQETEGREGDQIQRYADPTTGSNDGQSKKAGTVAHEESSDGDSGQNEHNVFRLHVQKLLHTATAEKRQDEKMRLLKTMASTVQL